MAVGSSSLSRSPSSHGDNRKYPQTSMYSVLLMGSDADVLTYVREALSQEEMQITALSLEQGIIRLQKGLAPDLILFQATGSRSLEVLASVRQLRTSVPVIVVSCTHSSQFVARTMKAGASDCILLPFDTDALKASARRFLSVVQEDAVGSLASEAPLSEDTAFVCASNRMLEIRGQCAILARVDLPVLIMGDSGTGKEVVAHYIHKMSPRGHRTFLKVNCAAMPADLLESELFGYEQGAFTGAVRAKPGKFEIGNMGTILLDEIGEMPTSLQSKLLQVLQDGTFSRLGGRNCIKVDVRVIAATNIDMNAAIAARTFREDLYYRLNGFSIHVPPLRERKEEIPIFIRYFMRRYSGKYAQQAMTMSDQLLKACVEHDWPGNLRELENYVKRFLVLGDERPMLAELRANRPASNTQGAPRFPSGGLKELAREATGEAEMGAMDEVLARHNWNRRRAAAELKISYKALLYKIRQYGLTPPETDYGYTAKAVAGR